jgi:hypothetical protein
MKQLSDKKSIKFMDDKKKLDQKMFDQIVSVLNSWHLDVNRLEKKIIKEFENEK